MFLKRKTISKPEKSGLSYTNKGKTKSDWSYIDKMNSLIFDLNMTESSQIRKKGFYCGRSP